MKLLDRFFLFLIFIFFCLLHDVAVILKEKEIHCWINMTVKLETSMYKSPDLNHKRIKTKYSLKGSQFTLK